jgi:protein-tyrosine-phosphatase
VKILYVCTANVCRSPSAQVLLLDGVSALDLPDVVAASAGVQAVHGTPGCDLAPALRSRSSAHRSRPLDRASVQWADLVLTAERAHIGMAVDLAPEVRSRAFTMLQAGRIASWLLYANMVAAGRGRAMFGPEWRSRFTQGDPRGQVSALDGNRDAWILEELDAARGLAGTGADDLRDPHVDGPEFHPEVYRQIWDATNALVTLLRAAA